MTSTSTYLGYRIFAADYNKTLKQTAASDVVARDTAYYQQNINKVKSVDDFVNNFRLFSYAMKAHGLSDKISAKALMKKVLEADPSDNRSLVNTLTDGRYKAFAHAFSFVTKKGSTLGTVADTTAAQSSDQESDTLGLYEKNAASVSTTDEAYYKANIGAVKTVDDLIGNSRLYKFVLTAYGIDPTKIPDATLKQGLRQAVESDVSDPHSEVNTNGNATLKAIAADFNFTADGKVTTQRLAQNLDDFTAMQAAYAATFPTDAATKAAVKAEGTYVGNLIGKATSIDNIVKDSRVVAYIGKAFGVANLTSATLRQILTSDPSDPTSPAAKLGDYQRKIAEAFNFSATGTITRGAAQTAQARSDLAETTRAYLEQALDTNAANSQGEGVRLALNFRQKAGSITSVFQILADTDLLKVVQTALNIPSTTSSENIDVQAKMITSRLKLDDLRNPTKLDKFISQFAALYDVANFSASATSTSTTSTSAASSILSLLSDGTSSSNYTTLSLFQ